MLKSKGTWVCEVEAHDKQQAARAVLCRLHLPAPSQRPGRRRAGESYVADLQGQTRRWLPGPPISPAAVLEGKGGVAQVDVRKIGVLVSGDHGILHRGDEGYDTLPVSSSATVAFRYYCALCVGVSLG